MLKKSFYKLSIAVLAQFIAVISLANGIKFTEEMKGFLSKTQGRLTGGFESELQKYDQDFEQAQLNSGNQFNFMFHLTVQVSDTREMRFHDVNRSGTMNGYVKTDLFGDRELTEELTVENGDFRLLTDGACEPENKNSLLKKMCYAMKFKKGTKTYLMYGFKSVHKDEKNISVSEIWKDTSTLYTTILEYSDSWDISEAKSKGAVVARGKLKILPQDFVTQMTTMAVVRPDRSQSITLNEILNNKIHFQQLKEELNNADLIEDSLALTNFVAHFASSLWQVFIDPTLNGFKSEKKFSTNSIIQFLQSLPKKLFNLFSRPQTAKDRMINLNPGVEERIYTYRSPVSKDSHQSIFLKLHRYNAETLQNESSQNPVVLIPGLGVDNGIFTQTTTNSNLVEHLIKENRDVWLVDFRANIHYPEAKIDTYSADSIALLDIPFAIQKVLEVTGASGVHLVGHCYGSTTLFMSLLSGLNDGKLANLNPGVIKSVLSSQVSIYAEVPEEKRAQIALLGPFLKEQRKIKYLSSSPNYVNKANLDESGFDRVFSAFSALTTPMIPKVGEILTEKDRKLLMSDVHHRILFIFGELYRNENLSDAMIDHGLAEIFGPVGMGHIRQLMAITEKGHIVNSNGEEVYNTPENLKRLTMPITFIHGRENKTWLLKGTEKSYQAVLKSQLEIASNENDRNETKARIQLRIIDGYGHLDSIFGENAEKDVYPLISEHLKSYIK